MKNLGNVFLWISCLPSAVIAGFTVTTVFFLFKMI